MSEADQGEGSPRGTGAWSRLKGWVHQQPSRRLSLALLLTIWASFGFVFVISFGRFFGPLEPHLDVPTDVFVVYILPGCLSFACTYEISTFYRPPPEMRIHDEDVSEVLAALEEEKAPPPTRLSYSPAQVTKSGFPATYNRGVRPKSGKQLQKEVVQRQEESALRRFERWSSRRFSLYKVFHL